MIVEEKYQYYIKEKKTAVAARRAMLSALSHLFPWQKMKRALSTRRLMKVNVFDATSVLRYAQ